MMRADKRLQALGKADEAHGQRAVLQDFRHAVVRLQGVGVDPNALPHQERVIAGALRALDFETMQQLADHQVDDVVEAVEELLLVAVGLDGETRQVDAGEA